MRDVLRFAFANLIVFIFVAVAGQVAPAQAADPVIDVTRLMSGGNGSSLRFYDQNARMMISDVGLVFRPEGDHNTVAEVVRTDTGEIASTLEFFPDYQWSNTVFGDVRPQGPGVIDLPGAGEYQLRFVVNGNLATSFPFTVVAEESDDAFNPDTKYHYRGPWEELVYLKTSRSFTDLPIEVTFWTSALDMPTADGRRQRRADDDAL